MHDAPECHDGIEGPDVGSLPSRSVRASRRSFFLAVIGLSLVLIAASGLAFLGLGQRPQVRLDEGATIYYNEACGDCAVYLNGDLVPALQGAGAARIVVKDYVNDRDARAELTALNDAMGIPFELQSHLVTFVAGSVLTVFEGHVPRGLIEDALSLAPTQRPPRLLLYQDSMGSVESYRAWAFAGVPQTYPVTVPLDGYLVWYAEELGSGSADVGSAPLLPLVVMAGLLDGLNPCAFAVLVFLVSFLYALRAPRADVFRVGSVYAYAVFLAYFLIGLGLLGAIVVSQDAHAIAKVAAVGVIALGTLALARIAAPRLPSMAAVSHAMWPRIRRWVLSGSVPSSAVAGILVGLCTFPCSGGIYVAVLGLLASRTTFLEGLAYLYLYNGMYILPLILVLTAVSNRRMSLAVARWERSHTGAIRHILAAGMIAMGVALLIVSW